MTRLFALFACCVFCVPGAFAKGKQEYKKDPIAATFGTLPDIHGMHLSPDGTKISMIKWLPNDTPAAVVFDLVAKKGTVIAATKKGEAVLDWCDWANNERLLCGYRNLNKFFGTNRYFAMTRLIAVNADGKEMRTMIDRKNTDQFSQFQDRVVDWLVDDKENVLMQVPNTFGSGVGKLDIYTGHMSSNVSSRDQTYSWIADGRGNARLYQSVQNGEWKWYVRDTKDSDWRVLHEKPQTDMKDKFQPIGFGDGPNQLLYVDRSNGKLSLFEQDLSTGEKPHIIFSDPNFDITSLLTLGKYRRLAAVGYYTDKLHWKFFDRDVAKVHQDVSKLFPGSEVDIVDESWDRRYYLVVVSSDRDPGSVFRLDRQTNRLAKIALIYPQLAGQTMAPMKPIMFKARDGAKVPGYLTLPPGASKGPLPTVVFPHGGPSARDVWSFDPIVQFLAANGYAVLQVNYRGSSGYGEDWSGNGGFKNWRQAISDITDGAKSLVADGTSDGSRMCVVGWSYGGYAALMSAIEQPDLYKCVVSIAGVTDLKMLAREYQKVVGSASIQTFIGTDDATLDSGSPQERAAEIKAPVLLFQGEKDQNVQEEQASAMADRLQYAGKKVQYIEYDDVEHDIRRNQYRIDMLSRIGEFLAEYIGAAH